MKRAFTLIEALILLAVIGAIAAIIWPIFTRPNYPAPRSSCQSNLKQIGLGFLQYAQDYDERLPPARVTPTIGWADVLQPYIKSTQLFQCPSAPDRTTTPFLTDYFYNRRLARVNQEKLTSSALTIMAGDGDDNSPSWNSWIALPPDAVTNPNSPARRHSDTANYLFADGHVKALKPDAISSTFASPTSRATFATK